MDSANQPTIISENIQHITRTVAEMERMIKRFDTGDPSRIRSELNDTTSLIRKTKSEIDQLEISVRESGDRARKLQLDRIKSTFKQNVERFKAANELLLRREKESIARDRAESGKAPQYSTDDEESARLLPEDRLAQAQMLATGQENIVILEEREIAIRQLETDILGLNEMFRDIGIMIQDQGEMLDNIEAHVETAHAGVQKAEKEVVKAHRYKRSSRKITLCIVCILLTVFFILVIVIIIALGALGVFNKKN